MKNFKIVPLSLEYVNRIKTSQKDNFGHPLKEELATGRGPCRLSLKPFEVGVDKRLLFSHSPFEKDNAFNQSGPIFIHKNDVEPYSDIYNFPREIKANKTSFPLTLIGYDQHQNMAITRLVGDADVDDMIVEIFDLRPEIEYLHVRNAEACCFICKIERI